MDFIPEAIKLNFEESKTIELFNELLFLVDFIPEVEELFNKVLFLVDSIPEIMGLFGKIFFLIDFILEIIKLSFELKTIELFKKFYFLDLALEVMESSSKFCP